MKKDTPAVCAHSNCKRTVSNKHDPYRLHLCTIHLARANKLLTQRPKQAARFNTKKRM